MPVITQRTFTGGEIAPPLYSRCDTTKYATGLRTMRNMFIMRHGGVANRTGTKFVGEIADSSNVARLIEFIFSNDQTYVVEISGGKFRFINNGSYVTETAQTISGYTTGSTTKVLKNAHGLTAGDFVIISGSSNPNINRTFKVGTTTTNDFFILDTSGAAVNSSTWGAIPGGSFARIYSIASPYAAAHIQDLHYIQSADVMTLTHKSYQPYELKRFTDTNWTLTAVTFQPSINKPTNLAASPTTTVASATATYVVTCIKNETYEESYASDEAYTNQSPIDLTHPVVLTWTGNVDAHEYNVYKKVDGGVFGFVGIAGTTTTGYVFTISAGNATAGATYTNNSATFTVGTTIAGGVTLTTTGSGTPLSSGVLTKTSGVGDATLTFSVATPIVTFTDKGILRDTSVTPPITRNPFSTAAHSNNYPATCTYVQQRLGFANLAFDTESVQLSKIGQFHNFTTSSPIQEDDAVSFRMAGRQVNEVRHLLDLGTLVIFTASGEWGLQAGVITPSSISTKQFSYNGASSRRPIVINNTAIYVQARGSIVRDIGYNLQADGYTGNDLTVFSSHLFDGYQIVDWAYQKVPHSIVWAVRDDGTVVGMTYVKEHEIIGWHRHDFEGGFVENVCSVPEGDEDAVYFVVKRTVNGVTRRYVERMPSRRVDDLIDSAFMDSHVSFDGRNTTATNMTLSGGTTWSYTENLTLTASVPYFDSTHVGKEIHLTSGSDIIRFKINTVVGGSSVEGTANKTVPVSMRSTAINTWSLATKTLNGLWHLEGMDISVFADGTVVGSPYNDSYQSLTVTNGSVTLDKCFSVIHAGLPIVSDLETLDIDTAQGETMAPKKKNITKLSVMVENSIGFWAGQKPTGSDLLDGMVETKVEDLETYERQNNLITGTVDLSIFGNWNSNGRVFIRNVDPLPLSVLAIMPTGFVPVAGGKNG